MNPARHPCTEDAPRCDPMDRTRFAVDEWRLVERWLPREDLGACETLFAVANGYLGMRGNPEEGRPAVSHGTFINGFHETWRIKHAEEAFGFAKTGQTIVNVPDAKTMKLYVDDEPLALDVADLIDYERVLDFRSGRLTRDIVWATPSGKKVRIRTSRLVSFTERHLAVFTYEVTMLRGRAPIIVSSQVLNRQDGFDEYHGSPAAGMPDPRKASTFEGRVLDPRANWHSESRMLLGYQCVNSGMTLAVGADHTIETENRYEERVSTEPDQGKHVFRVRAEEGVPIRITKVVAYHSSRSSSLPTRELFDRCRRTLDRAAQMGVDSIVDEQRRWLEEYWANTDVRVSGQPAVQQAIRWCLFQLAQAAARADQMGVAAKGTSGSGYEGHYFWDTEVYVIPFLSYTNPAMARNALRFRINQLPAAITRAKEMTMHGALYPWRTINGEEASAYYAAGTAQFHIDADIAYALCKYVDVTGDVDLLLRGGLAVLVETARMWADLGFWRVAEDNRQFHIHGVTGPDEYTTVVNNNLYTNVMAKMNLQRAAETVYHLRARDPDAYQVLARRLGLADEEPVAWEDCARHMFIPHDEKLGIHPQDEHFLDRELWDSQSTPEDQYPLLLHYHPLVIYRYQVLKQADVVLALFLQSQEFTFDEKRADFEYYDPITTGDSTLSAVVQSIIAAEVGYHRMALDYFYAGLFVDLADLHSNASDGIHIASAGGVWNCLVHGFGGMRHVRDVVSFDPRLPETWDSLSYVVRLKGSRVRVHLTAKEIRFTVEEGGPVRVSVRGTEVMLRPEAPVSLPLRGQGPRLPSLKAGIPVIGTTRADGSVITATMPAVELAWQPPSS